MRESPSSDEQVVTGARLAVLAALLIAIYFAAGKFGLSFAVVHRSASAIWPPTGVAIAALLILGMRVWPAILLGAFLVNVTVDGSFVTALCIAVGNTLEGVAAAWLITHNASGVRCFERPRGIFRFVVLGALLSTLISPTIGVTTLSVAQQASWSAFSRIWLTWWLGDAVGALVVVPLIVLWFRTPRLDFDGPRLVELIGVLALVAGVSVFVFFGQPPLLSFLVLPALAWVAFRFGQREVATAVAMLAGIATFGTVQGRGPFAIVEINESLVTLQAFLGTIAVMMLAIAAFVGERREAMLAAQSAARSKDQFIAMLSHELRNPLQAIGSSADLLGKPPLTEAVLRQSVEIIQRQTGNLTRLVNDLLDVTRVIEGKSGLLMQPIDLAETVRRSMATLASGGRTDRHRIEYSLEPAWVQGDSVRLDQVVVNLITNAIKYTPDHGVIRVSVWKTADECVLQVRDSGIGISEELLPRIFDLFTQGSQRLDRREGGLGIGLALVRQIVALHGGTVRGRSSGPGRGSEFTVVLPLIPVPAPVVETPTATLDEVPGVSLRVLLVEDNADAREALHILLAMLGHQVHEAADGRVGVEQALRLKPDLALVDIGLPEIDGYEVARTLRSKGETLQLVAVTGYGQPEDVQRAKEAGFDRHLVKPVNLKDLERVLAHAVTQVRP